MRTFPLIALLILLAGANPCDAASQERARTLTPLEKANEYIAANKLVVALDILNAYRPSREEMSAYHYAYARVLKALKHPYESIEHYRIAYVYADTAADKERLLFDRCDVYAGMGYSSEAAVCFSVFLKQFPQSNYSERAQLGIAEARYRLGEFREALVHYEKAGTSHPVLLDRAKTLLALNRNEEAHKLFRDMIEHDPELVRSTPETMYYIGESYRRMGKLHDARIFFELVKDPALKYRIALGLGLLAMTEKRFDDAVSSFTAAAESPERSLRREAIMDRADAYLHMGKYEEAQAALMEIKKNYPYGKQYDAAVVLLARLYRGQGKFSESVALLRALILRRTPVAAALDEIEAVFMEAMDRDPEQFIKLWNTAGRWLLDPSRTQTLVKIAPHLRSAGKPFLDVCSWLVKYGPGEAQSAGWLLLAHFYADLGDVAAAQSCLKQANSANDSDEVLRIRARIALASQDGPAASASIMKLHDVNEDDALLLLDAMKLLTNVKKETAFCDRAFQKKTYSLKTTVRFADILYAAGSRQKALAYYRAAVAVKPGKSLKDVNTAADADWAYYRISAIAKGEDAENSLKAIQRENNAVGRFAAAELKGSQLRRRAE